MAPVLAVIPIALAMLAGWLSRRLNLVEAGHWAGIEALSFRVLIPAILIHSIAGADLSPEKIGRLSLALIGATAIVGTVALAVRFLLRQERLSNPALSTLFQTSTRWNAFVSLAAADLMAGPEGVLLIAVSMAVLIPLINIANIVTVAALCSGTTGPKHLAMVIIRNPIIIGCAIGLAVNFLFGGLPAVIGDAMQIVGRSALGVGLLAVGAGLNVRRFVRVSTLVVTGAALRPVALPVLFLLLALSLGLGPEEVVAGILVTAVPAATNGYFVARAMGGDADLYIDIMGWQTILSFFAIPLYLYAAAALAM